MQGSLKGPAGAVRSLALHPQLPIMASVGLDRFLRLHNVESNKLLCKLYLKLQLTAVAGADVPFQLSDNAVNAQAKPAAVDGAASDIDEQIAGGDLDQRKLKHTKSKRSGSHNKSKPHKKKPKLDV